jgi:hypothetical protein
MALGVGGGGVLLLRSEGLGEVWQRESLTNLYPMRLASRPFTPAAVASVVHLYRAVCDSLLWTENAVHLKSFFLLFFSLTSSVYSW